MQSSNGIRSIEVVDTYQNCRKLIDHVVKTHFNGRYYITLPNGKRGVIFFINKYKIMKQSHRSKL